MSIDFITSLNSDLDKASKFFSIIIREMIAEKPKGEKLSIFDRLTIIEEMIEEIGPQTSLKVVVNDDPMTVHQTLSQQGNVVYSYELIGSKSTRITQNNNILQKLQIMEKTQAQPKRPKPIEQTNEEEQLAQAKPAKESEEKSMFRYFTESIKCFRCKKLGHHDYACLDEFSCYLCLSSQHHSQKCPQKVVCFRCYNYGHMVNQCKQKEDGQFCQNCRRKHLGMCGFVLKGTEQLKQMFSMEHLYNSEEIRCLKCFNYGHHNCEPVVIETNPGYYKRPYTPNDRMNQTQQYNKDYKYYSGKRNKY